jgi:hypothetical protein
MKRNPNHKYLKIYEVLPLKKSFMYILHLVSQDIKKRPTYYCRFYIVLILAKCHNLMIFRTKSTFPKPYDIQLPLRFLNILWVQIKEFKVKVLQTSQEIGW